MNPPDKAHVLKVLQQHRQFPGDYCAVSALEFVSKVYGCLAPDQFPLQSNPSNEHKGFDEPVLQKLVSLVGSSQYYDIQSAVEAIEKETIQGKCVSVSLQGFLTFDLTGVIPIGYHTLVSLMSDGQPILIDPQVRQALAQGKGDLARVLQKNSDMNPERKTIHMEILEPKK